MVALPITGVAWLGARGARFEAERIRLRLEGIALDALSGVAAGIDARVRTIEREIDAIIRDVGTDVDAMRLAARTHRLVRQVFRLDPAGELRYPRADAQLPSTREREFLERTHALWEGGFLGTRGAPEGAGEVGAPGGAWQSWTWGSGTSYLYWRRVGGGEIHGVEVEGAGLLADLIAVLPQTPVDPEGAEARVVMVDSDGQTLYQWGTYDPEAGELPLATLRLGAPFAAWSLEYHAAAGGRAGSPLLMFASLGSFALLLAGGAIYLWRESTREAREASRRVSFVNHVSHELKTPLTNIRLYAELLEQSLGADAEGGHAEKVAVIVDESRRLSRLIHNVLTFARRDRGSLAVTLHPGVVDDVVRSVIEDFRPRLDQKGIAVELFLSAGKRVLMDPDALEQILGNLVGNAEKYASAGGYLGLDTGHVAARTRITVRDRGPGVPVPQRERVFEPFYRSSDRLTDGVAGTGIGLTIARDLARLHGGDLRVEQPEQGSGALFVLELETPVAPGPPEDRDGPAAPGAGGLPEGGKGKA